MFIARHNAFVSTKRPGPGPVDHCDAKLRVLYFGLKPWVRLVFNAHTENVHEYGIIGM